VDGELVVSWTETHGGFAELGELFSAGGWVFAAGSYALKDLLG
jgi:hypothetical protein